MAVYKLKLMPLVETRGVIEYEGTGPAIKGSGPDDYVCPKCEYIIAKSVTLSDLQRFVNGAFRCPGCKTDSVL